MQCNGCRNGNFNYPPYKALAATNTGDLDVNQENQQTGKVYYNGGQTQTIKGSASTENLAVSGKALGQDGLVQADSGSIDISNLKSLQIKDEKGTRTHGGIMTNPDGAININNIKDISIEKTNGNGYNVGLYAKGGSIGIRNVDNVNIHSMDDAIYAEHPQFGNGDGSISIIANNEVNLSGIGGIASAVNGNSNSGSAPLASVNIEAKKVNISATGAGVYTPKGGDKVINGKTNISIIGHDSVNITSNSSAIMIDGADKGQVNLTIESDKGSVTIDGVSSINKNSVLNLAAAGDTSSSSGVYKVNNGGTVNFNKGTWSINKFDGDATGNLKVAGPAALNVNTTVNVGSFTAGANSTTSFDVSKNASINVSAENNVSAEKNISVDKSAKAIVYGATRNTEYKLLTANGQKLKNDIDFQHATSGDNKYLKFKMNNDGSIISSLDAAAAKADVQGTVIPNVAFNDKLSGDTAAAKFFDKAVRLAGDAKTAANSLNSVANIGELGGTSHGTYTASNIMTDLVNEHLSLATHGKQDRDLWAHYIHNRENVDGMSLGGLDADYDANYNGVIVGGEFYNKGKVSAGAAFSYMDGSIKGNTLTARTENDADYYGLSLYGKIDNGDSAVFGDISYLHGKNDITQTNMGEKITADPKSDAFSIGVRAEKSFEAGAGQLVPYIGARYMKLGVGDYKDSFGINYDADEQDLFMVPVGVSYSTEIKHDDWTVSPYAKAGYVWTFGDRETDQTVSLAGAADTFGFETANSGSFVGQLGVNAENDAMSYGLGYSYQKGDSVQANKWMANVLFKF